MTKTYEIAVTILILAAMYCALPLRHFNPLAGSHEAQSTAESQAIVVADGTDPIPMKR